ncbi:hypothetical protein VTI28DRAFT_7045 [Corynascus sepedonium]
MVWDESSWPNSTLPDNSTVPPPNSTIWAIPPDAGRSLQPDIIACAVITFLIAFTFVALRFYTRGWLNNVLGASDWCILPALLCAAGMTASSLEQVARGAGKHAWEVDLSTLPAFERASWYGILFYNLSLTLTRISILLLYSRIFTYSWIKRAIRVVMILVISLGIWLVVSVCTACMPLEAFWDWSLFFKQQVFCQSPNLWWANAALHIASDFVIIALPLPVLSSLNLPRRQKYAIIGVFALGFFVCIFSIIRLVTLIEITQSQSWDGMYTATNLIYWTNVEVNASISCACIMTLKPLIQRLFPGLLSPSKSVRELPTLQWITPINHDGDDYEDAQGHNHGTVHSATTTDNNNNNKNSHQRNSTPPELLGASTLTRRESNTSTNKRRGSVANALPQHHEEALEKSRYYHGFTTEPKDPTNGGSGGYDLDRDLDLEAQRTCSSCSPVSSWPPTSDDGRGGGPHDTSRRSSISSSNAGILPGKTDEGGKERERWAEGGRGGDWVRRYDTPPLQLRPEMEPGEHALRAPPRAHLRKPPPSPPSQSQRSPASSEESGTGMDWTTSSRPEAGAREGVEFRQGVRYFPLKTGQGVGGDMRDRRTGRDRA